MSFRGLLGDRLAELDRQGLLRSRGGDGQDAGLVNVCSNDYLGRAAEHVSRETMASSGAGASRLIYGTRDEHTALEAELADWMASEDALLFTSGYAANVGTVSALAEPGDLIVSDELNHASIIDGCRLSKARVAVCRHRDLAAFEAALREPARRKWVVTESYFSMDAVSPDLSGLRALCDAADAFLVVDEAHALGVFGPEGTGLCGSLGVKPDVLVGTLGKSVGVQGAFVAGIRELVALLWNRSRSFVFSTATSPALAEWTLRSVRAVRGAEHQMARLAELSDRLDAALRAAGVPLSRDRRGPIFPILLETPERAMKAARLMAQRGFRAQAIRPPTVPPGTSRLRVALNATLRPETVDALAMAIGDACSAS